MNQKDLLNLHKSRESYMITIRKLTTIAELEMVQQLDIEVWDGSPIPIHQTATAIKNGGIIMGAFDGNHLIGFNYGFAGFKEGKVYLCSHMMGIASQYRAQGIGEALKREQRNVAIEYGYDMMKWTYDPLETRNGYLNLTKLRAVCDTYIENCYGKMQDGLNKGLPSDRFEVSWYLTSDYINKNTLWDLSKATIIAHVQLNEQGLPVLNQWNLNHTLDASAYLLPVPKNFQGIKASNPELALDWRMKTRHIFQTLFSKNYVAVQLERDENLHHYVFVKKESISI